MEIEKIRKALEKEPDEVVSKLLDQIEENYGEIPYILNFLKDTPELFIPKVLYDNSIMREFKRMDPKTIELISIGVSAAIRCEHCLKMHIRIANRLGISKEEIFDAILIASTLSTSAVLAEGTRALDSELDDGNDICDKKCDMCNILEDV
jgi:AhpD family alkylhydroperoxidase